MLLLIILGAISTASARTGWCRGSGYADSDGSTLWGLTPPAGGAIDVTNPVIFQADGWFTWPGEPLRTIASCVAFIKPDAEKAVYKHCRRMNNQRAGQQGRVRHRVKHLARHVAPGLVTYVMWLQADGRCLSRTYRRDVVAIAGDDAALRAHTAAAPIVAALSNVTTTTTPSPPPPLEDMLSALSSDRKREAPLLVLGIQCSAHDGALTIARGGIVLAVLQLERLFNHRYHDPCGIFTGDRPPRGETPAQRRARDGAHADEWNAAYRAIAAATDIVGEAIDVGVANLRFGDEWLKHDDARLLEWPVRTWKLRSHHEGHASLAFWDSPFTECLVLVFDGGGGTVLPPPDDHEEEGEALHLREMPFAIYHGDAARGTGALRRVAQASFSTNSYGAMCCEIGALQRYCGGMRTRCAGKLMGYAGLGTPRFDQGWVDALEGMFLGFVDLLYDNDDAHLRESRLVQLGVEKGLRVRPPDDDNDGNGGGKGGSAGPRSCSGRPEALLAHLGGAARLGADAQRDVAASIQAAFARVVFNLFTEAAATAGFLEEEESAAAPPAADGPATEDADASLRSWKWTSAGSRVDGIALSGGGSLNVLFNAMLRRRLGVPVYVPTAPDDGGISTGLVWLAQPPPTLPRPTTFEEEETPPTHGGRRLRGGRGGALAYAGLPLFDRAALPDFARRGGARRVGPAEVAALLVDEGAVVGVARGRAEFGPRALGHRSLLALPSTGAAKDAMNLIKAREAWRPVAPVLLDAHAPRVFAEDVDSPHMSFAPRLRPEMRDAAPAIWHADGTARPQTVVEQDDPWLHALLRAVARRAPSGLGLLINTSFNTKGQPLVNRADRALCMHCELRGKGLSYVLLEDWLFEPDGACRVCAFARAELLLCGGDEDAGPLGVQAKLARRRRRMRAVFRKGAQVLVRVSRDDPFHGSYTQRAAVTVAQRAGGGNSYRAEVEWYRAGQHHRIRETGSKAEGFVVQFHYEGKSWKERRTKRPSIADYLCPDEITTLETRYGFRSMVEEEGADTDAEKDDDEWL